MLPVQRYRGQPNVSLPLAVVKRLLRKPLRTQ
jgi:hypothetical protein